MHCPLISLSKESLSLSRVVAGMWRLADWQMEVPERVRLLQECIDLGVTSFDLADIYGDYQVETQFGEALTSQPGLRNQMQLVSKCGIKLLSKQRPLHHLKHYDTSAAHISASVDASLHNLGTDHLDLLLIHRPDPLMDFDEIAQVFEQCRAAGKVLHFGVSNFSSTQFEALNARIPLVTNQLEFSPLQLAALDNGVFDTLQHHGVAPMVWSALAGGALFSTPAANPGLTQTLERVAKALNISPTATVYAWIMRLPSRPLPLTGSRRLEVIRDAVTATKVQMSTQQWFAILEAARGHEVA
jgi:predicted oxidoreductase